MAVRDGTERIVICDYDPVWPERFIALADRIRADLGALITRIEHVGSTAVPGLPAKSVIDLDIVVRTPVDIDEAVRRLAGIGYVHQGDLGIAGREAFKWPPGEPRHHLYLMAEGAAEFRRHLAFRDALRADSELRDQFAALKRSLAAHYADDREAYVNGKTVFVEAVLRGAATAG